MTLYDWLSLAAVCLLGAATPGPSLALISSHTLKISKTAGRVSSLSHALAVGLYALASTLGLTSVFILKPELKIIFSVAGAGYLIYLAIQIIRSHSPSSINNESNVLTISAGAKQAFLIAFLNPKLAIFFIALFSQFIPANGISLSMIFILVVTVFVIDLLWYLLIVEVLEKAKHKIRISSKRAKLLSYIQATLFIVIAVNALIFL